MLGSPEVEAEVDFEYQEAFIECRPRHQTRVEVRPNLGLTCITRQVHGVDDEGERIQNRKMQIKGIF